MPTNFQPSPRAGAPPGEAPAGAGRIAEGIGRGSSLSPRRVVYVSCNPVSLAEDLAVTTGRGYRLAAIGIVDMFPNTSHVESIALLEAGD